MILVPVISTALIGLVCVAAIWFSILHGIGFAAGDPKEFSYTSMAVAEAVEHRLESGRSLETLGAVIDKNNMRIIVKKDGAEIFAYGELMTEDDKLLPLAGELNGEVTIAHEGRSMFMTEGSIRGADYTIYLFGGNDAGKGYNNFKLAFVIVFALLAAADRHPEAMVLGVRNVGREMPLKSRMGNQITRTIFQMTTGVKVSDTQTGLRAFNSALIDRLLLIKGERYEYETNVLIVFGLAAAALVISTIRAGRAGKASGRLCKTQNRHKHGHTI